LRPPPAADAAAVRRPIVSAKTALAGTAHVIGVIGVVADALVGGANVGCTTNSVYTAFTTPIQTCQQKM
jgi:hypothetical protein